MGAKMWKKLAIGALTLWVSSLAIFGYYFVRGTGETGDDGRQAVVLTRAERNLVLGEMRMLLAGVQTILEAVTLNDLKLVETTASSLGMRSAADVNPVLMGKLPLEFKSTGMGVHERFDELAARVRGGLPKEKVIVEVSDIMRTCVGCHEAYRLDEARVTE